MLRTLMRLDAFQSRFVEADVGPVMLSGGPGVGKTRSVVARAIQLMMLGVRPDDVALLTPHDHLVPHLKAEFEGMPQRFQQRRRLLEREEGDIDLLQRAVQLGTQIFVGTPYQYAHRVLRDHDARPSTVWTNDDAIAVIHELERTLPQVYGIPYEPGRGTARRFFHWQGEVKLLPPVNPAPPIPVEGWRQLYNAYGQERNQQQACDRYDLLAEERRVVDRLNADRHDYAARQRPHFLIDDFQDIPEAAFWLLDALCGRQQSLSVAVDPGQPAALQQAFRPLETFRGTYLRAPEYRLMASRRSTQSVTHAVERIALHGRPEAPPPYQGYVGQAEAVPAVRLYVLSGRRNLETANVIRLVELSLDNGGAYSEMAVICLDAGQAAPLAAAFWARDVPHSIELALTKSSRLLSTDGSAAPVPSVRQVISALRLLVNPFDHAAFTDVVSMGLAPGRASLKKDEFAQVTQLDLTPGNRTRADVRILDKTGDETCQGRDTRPRKSSTSSGKWR